MKQIAIPTSILAQFYAGAVLRVMVWWVEQEMRLPSQELADYINRLLLPFKLCERVMMRLRLGQRPSRTRQPFAAQRLTVSL